jgi:hypothetical protein
MNKRGEILTFFAFILFLIFVLVFFFYAAVEISYIWAPSEYVHAQRISVNFQPSRVSYGPAFFDGKVGCSTHYSSEKYSSTWKCGSYGNLSTDSYELFNYPDDHKVLEIRTRLRHSKIWK